MPAVLLATCARLPAGDEDGDLLLQALERQGIDAQWAVWTDPAVDWSAGLVVLRSTWDYTDDRDSFLDWIGRLPRVANEAGIVAWNSDKVYLRDVDAAGVPVVPTTFVEPMETVTLFGAGSGHPGAAELVVKPSVGAGSRGAGRFTPDRADDAREHLEKLQAAGRTVLVQPYLDAVDRRGETALIYLAGRFSHAIRKGPMLPQGTVHPMTGRELYVEERIESRTPQPTELAVGDAAIALIRQRFGADPLYARVDLLPAPDGPVVVELELVEPSLFLQHGAGADPADALAAAIAGRA